MCYICTRVKISDASNEVPSGRILYLPLEHASDDDDDTDAIGKMA